MRDEPIARGPVADERCATNSSPADWSGRRHDAVLSGSPVKLADACRFALSLPEAVEAPHHEASSFRVRGRIFATTPPDGEHLHVFVDAARVAEAVASHAEAFELLRWGTKIVGVRIVLAHARAADVRALLVAAWSAKAPKGLVKAFRPEGGRG